MIPTDAFVVNVLYVGQKGSLSTPFSCDFRVPMQTADPSRYTEKNDLHGE